MSIFKMDFGCIVFTNIYNTLPLEIWELIFLMISKNVIKCEDCDNKESLIVACQLLKY